MPVGCGDGGVQSWCVEVVCIEAEGVQKSV